MKLIVILFILISAIDSYSQTQAEMNQNAINDYNKADKKLNLSYKLLISKLESPEKELFILAQKDWIKYKESHCKYDASSEEGGSIQPLIKYSCLTSITNERIEYINSEFKILNR